VPGDSLLMPLACIPPDFAELGDLIEIARGSLRGAPRLVRPDGYMAARGVADITAYLRLILADSPSS
jgi:hypothetical protein